MHRPRDPVILKRADEGVRAPLRAGYLFHPESPGVRPRGYQPFALGWSASGDVGAVDRAANEERYRYTDRPGSGRLALALGLAGL